MLTIKYYSNLVGNSFKINQKIQHHIRTHISKTTIEPISEQRDNSTEDHEQELNRFETADPVVPL